MIPIFGHFLATVPGTPRPGTMQVLPAFSHVKTIACKNRKEYNSSYIVCRPFGAIGSYTTDESLGRILDNWPTSSTTTISVLGLT